MCLAFLIAAGVAGLAGAVLNEYAIRQLRADLEGQRRESDAKFREAADALLRVAREQEGRLRRFEEWEKNGVLRPPPRSGAAKGDSR